MRNADLGILHSLYNQAPKKVILYEKQYIQRARNADIGISRLESGQSSSIKGAFVEGLAERSESSALIKRYTDAHIKLPIFEIDFIASAKDDINISRLANG
jgi:hypothetical protein